MQTLNLFNRVTLQLAYVHPSKMFGQHGKYSNVSCSVRFLVILLHSQVLTVNSVSTS